MYLITQSLLSAWGYMFSCQEGYEEEAKASFLATLNREKSPPTQAMLDGIAFENEVYAVCNGENREPHKDWESGIQAVAGVFGIAMQQVTAMRPITVDGTQFLVYGILDGLRAGTIYDVKKLSKSMGSVDLAGKYLGSPQHSAYFYIVPEAHEFIYLVSDGKDLYIERYTPEETPFIGDIISQFIQSISAMGLLEAYKEKWVSR